MAKRRMNLFQGKARAQVDLVERYLQQTKDALADGSVLDAIVHSAFLDLETSKLRTWIAAWQTDLIEAEKARKSRAAARAAARGTARSTSSKGQAPSED